MRCILRRINKRLFPDLGNAAVSDIAYFRHRFAWRHVV